MNQAANFFFDVITALFVVLTILVAIVVIGIANGVIEPPAFAVQAANTPATLAAFSTATPSATASPSYTPTITDTPTPTGSPTATATPTFTATPSRTPTFTATPSLTPTGTLTPSLTPTASRTPTASFTPTITLTPTATMPTPSPTNTLNPALLRPTTAPLVVVIPTTPAPAPAALPPALPGDQQSAYPYIVQPGSVIARANENPSGCNWQGVAGQVTNTQGDALLGVEVRAVQTGNPSFVVSALSGSNPVFGPSGWELTLGQQPAQVSFEVALWQGQTQISPAQTVVFPGVCEQNLVTFNFIQVRPN